MTYIIGRTYKITAIEMYCSHYWNGIPVFQYTATYNGKKIECNYIDHSLKG